MRSKVGYIIFSKEGVFSLTAVSVNEALVTPGISKEVDTLTPKNILSLLDSFLG